MDVIKTAAILIAGYFLATYAAGRLIAIILRAVLKTSGEDALPQGGIRRMGEYIGWLERLLAITFILVGEYNGMGFVLAAKSILRYGEVKSDPDRKLAEYVILGTLMSFSTALITGILLRAALNASLEI